MEKYLKNMDEHVDVVEVEVCAATEVEIIQNVQMNNQVRGKMSAPAREMIPSVQMCNQVQHVDGETSEIGPCVNQIVYTHVRGGGASEMIPSADVQQCQAC